MNRWVHMVSEMSAGVCGGYLGMVLGVGELGSLLGERV